MRICIIQVFSYFIPSSTNIDLSSYFAIQLVNKRLNELINSYNWLWRYVPELINCSSSTIGRINTSAYKLVKFKCKGKRLKYHDI